PTMDLSALTRLSPSLSAPWLEHHAILPLSVAGGRARVATWREVEEVDESALDDLALAFDADVELVRLPEQEVRRAIRRVYGDESTAQGVIDAMEPGATGGEAGQAIDDLLVLANEAPVVKLVNLLLVEALGARASDVHLESYVDGPRVRYRVDGVLQDAPSPPPQLAAAVVSRLKIMADLDIAERRLPQDGRIRLRLQDRTVDVRVSTVPTLHGESVVLRLLDKERGRISLEELGMAPETLARFREVVSRPHGIVLATGPTGSGKTTTLYAAVELLRTGREKILTVEDPVEYELPGVPQVPVNEKLGVTFATALRALLRQDPDVMLVGEIRDPETAEIATQAALTGHLVLSTLHTNDAPSALTRLRELGVAPYLVSSTVEAVLAQRLVRTLCGHCRTSAPPTAEELRLLGLTRDELPAVARATGCAECRGAGYRGRVGVYELLVVTDAIRAAVLAGAATGELRRLAMEAGMRTLRDDGHRLVATGVTTSEEVLRSLGHAQAS
ncbi:MAG TPA: ATPase, T2SS/T4P/T4SS family, partial [Gemmatimonadaceae bacterium]|nr:ATPase, T2SS/T4P/T4SS family [Gemmatimonadaceae bacterium]